MADKFIKFSSFTGNNVIKYFYEKIFFVFDSYINGTFYARSFYVNVFDFSER